MAGWQVAERKVHWAKEMEKRKANLALHRLSLVSVFFWLLTPGS